jgi:UPF0755 protein
VKLRSFLVAVLLLVALGRAAWYYEVHVPRRAPTASPQALTVPQGASVEAIGHQLQILGLVPHPLIFRALVVVRGDAARLKAGEYAFDGPLSLDEIVDELVQGQFVRHDLTIPEGKSRADVADIVGERDIDSAAFLAASADPALIRDLDPVASDLEGYLFPDTYDIPPSPRAAAELVHHMVQRFRDVMVPLLPKVAQSGLSLRQVVTLASIVELETARKEERPHIAAVFLNRLHRGMLLQTDPTVIYALRAAGTYDGNIHKKDLGVDSPYNTYKYAGLPPGPIASPGREALFAVLDPAPVKDLYFVSRNDGTHQFSATLAEHEQAVTKYQRHRHAAS